MVLPAEIPTKGLFDLDINDIIWEDVGLIDEDDGEQVPPPWLCNEQVRKGIRGILLQDRCNEEFRRLRHETCSMHEWLAEEWQVVGDTIQVVEELGMFYFLFWQLALIIPV